MVPEASSEALGVPFGSRVRLLMIFGGFWDPFGTSWGALGYSVGHLFDTFWSKIELRTEVLGIQGLKIRDGGFFLIFGHPGTHP